jgi:hypothetical protein
MGCIGALAVAIGIAAPAHAAGVTSTQITTPADPHYAFFDWDAASPQRLTVSGTATGTGTVDIVCARGAAVTPFGGVANNVPVVGGAFSVAGVPLDSIAGTQLSDSRPCQMHAIPSGSVPSTFDNFTGPRLAVSKLARQRVSGAGANDGIVYDFYLYAAGIGFSADYRSFGFCGVSDTMPGDPVTLATTGYAMYCNGFPPDRPTIPEWGLKVDGEAAYPPGNLYGGTGGAGLQANAGFPELTLDPLKLNPANGDVTLTEHNPLVKCAPSNDYPPTPAADGCGSFEPVPVKLDRTTEHTRAGQVIRVVDRWSSTDGHTHALDLTLEQDHCFSTYTSDCSSQIVYRFPGQSAYAAQPDGATIAGPFAGAEPILAKDATDPALGGTAVIPAQSSDGATIYEETNWDAYGLHYAGRVVPATGALTLTHYYVTGRTPTEAEQLAAEVKASLQPTPPPPGPGNGGTPGGGTPGTGTVVPGPTKAPARPKLSRRGSVGTVRKGKTFLVTTGDRVKCPAGGATCVVRITAKARKVTVAKLRVKVPAGKTAKLAFRLNGKGARALKLKRRLRLSVALSARAGSGKAVTRKRTVTVKAPRKR